MTRKIDATRPFYAVVGAGDLAVEYARNATADVQARFGKVELKTKALRDQARTVVTTRIDGLTEEAKGARSTVENRVKDARTSAEQAAKDARATVESRVKGARSQVETYVNEAVAEVTGTYGDLAGRGQKLVARVRGQQAAQDAKAATKTATAKAKTAKTQTSKAAKSTASTARRPRSRPPPRPRRPPAPPRAAPRPPAPRPRRLPRPPRRLRPTLLTRSASDLTPDSGHPAG